MPRKRGLNTHDDVIELVSDYCHFCPAQLSAMTTQLCQKKLSKSEIMHIRDKYSITYTQPSPIMFRIHDIAVLLGVKQKNVWDWIYSEKIAYKYVAEPSPCNAVITRYSVAKFIRTYPGEVNIKKMNFTAIVDVLTPE